MTLSEFPDLAVWVGPPRGFGRGRDGKKPCYITLHYTAGAEGRTAAENGAAYDKTRTDGTSCHFFVDADSIVQEVWTWDRSNSAFSKGNRLGVHIEICGTLQTRAQWLDPTSYATLWNVAKLVSALCYKYGFPVRKLNATQTRAAWYSFPNGPTGINGHVDITNAYPEDRGDHTDPGTSFPWDVVFGMIEQIRRPVPTPTVEGVEDPVMMFHCIDTQASAKADDDVAAFALVDGVNIRVRYGARQVTMNAIAGHPKGTGDSQPMGPAEWNGLMDFYAVPGYRFDETTGDMIDSTIPRV